MDQKLELLRRVPLFAGLGGRELEEVGRLADEIDLPVGRVLTQEGRTASEFFLIVDGSVRVERGGRTVNRLGSGDFLGEIALIDGGPRTATATVEDGDREFHSLLEQFPAIQLAVLQTMATRVRTLDPDSCT
jgi:CRP-like cAMP-binding protein